MMPDARMQLVELPKPKSRKFKDRIQFLIDNQEEWIKICESNGISYAGPNGREIMLEDLAELAYLKSIL